MSGPVQNRREPAELTEAEVEAAIARIGERDAELAREASDVFESLTWGEGPQVLGQAGLQGWLWHVVPTKYLTDEAGFMTRLADAAAVLFDEAELYSYAEICRSDTTRGVHAGFDESDRAGRTAMAKAMEASGIEPPDLDDFAWGDVMGMAESAARSAVEGALEAAIVSGRLVVGGRGWRRRQAEVTAATLDGDHPVEPGQSWRTVVITERIQQWVDHADRRSPSLGRQRGHTANQLLHGVDPPAEVVPMMQPITWFLTEFGQAQPLTQAGYLSPVVVRRLDAAAPWDDPFAVGGPPRTEIDAPIVHRVRGWLQAAGALRKHNKTLRRTKLGAAAATDPVEAWRLLVSNLGAQAWDRFVVEACGLVMLNRDGEISTRELFADVVSWAGELGWATTDQGQRHPPGQSEVSRAFHGVLSILEMCGVVVESGDWGDRRVGLTAGGVTTMLAAMRASATGPRTDPW